MDNKNFFLWLSGVDPDIIKKCPKSEFNKYIGFGTLILIPAILAFFSMSYAISTLIDSPFLIFFAGLLWATIVLFIDRFIVTSFWRSEVASTNLTKAFFSRILLAVFIGVVVAHPLTLLIFQDSITYKLNEDYEKKEDSVLRVFNERIFHYEQIRNDIVVKWDTLILQKEVEKDCKNRLLTAEQTGTPLSLPCGVTSNLVGQAKRFNEIVRQIEELKTDINRLQKVKKSELIGIDSTITKLKLKRDKKIEALVKIRSSDYLSRVVALEKIADEPGNRHVSFTKWFLILLFVFIDILPVSMKYFSQRGFYEEYYDESLQEVKTRSETERKIMEDVIKSQYSILSQTKMEQKFKMDEITQITKSAVRFIDDVDSDRIYYDKKIAEIVEEMNNLENKIEKRNLAIKITQLKKLFNSAFGKAIKNFQIYINKQ